MANTGVAERPPGLPYRARAREHLSKAQEWLRGGDLHSTAAACLFLRMAIEALAYGLLEAYRAEVDFAAMRKWQPNRVSDELLEIDAGADRTVSISIYDADGKEVLSGEERRLKADWIAKEHRALGSFLHEPTIRQVEEGHPPAEAAMRARAEAIAAEIDAVLASSMHNINIGQFVGFECHCGFKIRRKEESLGARGEMRCAGCGRRWTYFRDIERNGFEFNEVRSSFPCEKCRKGIWVTAYDVEQGGQARCECGAVYRFEPGFKPCLIEPRSDAGVCEGRRRPEGQSGVADLDPSDRVGDKNEEPRDVTFSRP
jgi:hypothetical protein